MMTGASSEKIQRLTSFCAERGVDGVHLRRRSNIAWITDGVDTHVDLSDRRGIAEVVWTVADGKGLVLTDSIEAARLLDEEFGAGRLGWEVQATNWWEPGADVAELGLRLAADWPDDPFGPLRWSLTDLELTRVRDLGREAAGALETAMKAVSRGSTEHELASQIIGPLRARNIHTPVMLIASDERLKKYRHPIPTDKKIDRAVMAAICAQRYGLTVSATRLVHFGKVDTDLNARHAAVCRVDRTLHEQTRPGAKWCDILAAAQRTYAATGFGDEWKKHHQGGPMGYELRDFKATPTEARQVVERQLVGWNPSITGTKSEDTIVVTSGGHEIVTETGDWPLLEGRPEILVREP